MEEKKVGYKDIFQQKEYMKIIIASLVNRFGDSIDAIASAWIVYELTQKAYWSALIYALNLIPSVLITPLAGAFVEKRSKKSIMVITDLIRALCVAYIASAYLLNFLEGWHLIITTLIISTAEAFRGPSSSALTPLVLKEEYYDYGMSLLMSLSTIVEMVGTAAAAGIIALIGTSGAIYIDMATFVISALIITTLRVTEVSNMESKFIPKEYLNTLKEGFSYVLSLKGLIIICFVGMFLNAILVPFNSLQAPFVSEVMKSGAEVLSVMGVFFSISSLIASVSYPKVREHLKARSILSLCCFSIGLFYIGLIGAKPLYETRLGCCIVIAILALVMGLVVGWTNAFASVEFMKITDPKYMARSGALFTALCVAISPVASFTLSALAKFTSIEILFVGSGILALVVMLVMISNKTLKEMQ